MVSAPYYSIQEIGTEKSLQDKIRLPQTHFITLPSDNEDSTTPLLSWNGPIPSDNEDSTTPSLSWNEPNKAASQMSSDRTMAPPIAVAIPATQNVGTASQMAQVTKFYATMLAEQKSTLEKLNDASVKLARMEIELQYEKEAMVKLNAKLNMLEKENKWLREENSKLKALKIPQLPYDSVAMQ
jgi:hypothetical protein